MQDPIKLGLASGWKHIDASTLASGQTIETDVVIVGTGAGGGAVSYTHLDVYKRQVMSGKRPLVRRLKDTVDTPLAGASARSVAMQEAKRSSGSTCWAAAAPVTRASERERVRQKVFMAGERSVRGRIRRRR